MTRVAKMNLIPSFTLAKGSKCHACVQAKQPRKPHKPAKERHLAPLELIHSDLCEMNSVLTKGGKKYFKTLIDDSTRFCYVYLLNTKDEALHYFKIYKEEVENQLEKNEFSLIMVESTFLMRSIYYVGTMELFMRERLHIHPVKRGCQMKKPYCFRFGQHQY